MVKTSRYLCVGPGGINCNCCFPAPGSKPRRALFRRAKNRSRREAREQIRCDIINDKA